MTKYDSPIAMPTVIVEEGEFDHKFGKPDHFTQAEWDLATALDSFSLMGRQNVIDALEKWHDEIEDRRNKT